MGKMTVLLGMAVVAQLAMAAKTPADNGLPATATDEVSAAVRRAAALPHPRLFANRAGFAALRTRLATDEFTRLGAEHVRATADLLLTQQPLVRRTDEANKRILGVSRAALFRITTLAMAYRLYGNEVHLKRAVEEMRTVVGFTNWNPTHFLDTAEMSLAVAIGYDWLHDEIDPDARRVIAEGLARHGLGASRQRRWWTRARNNWGQVCHAGILAAALALADETNAAETGRYVQRCVNLLPLSMQALAPNGNYPEGPSYWNYGVEFNVVAMALLEGTLGSDFGLAALPGFRETGAYPDLVTGPSGQTFNYADGGWRRDSSFATWYFAARFNRPDLTLYFERDAYRRATAARRAWGNRLLPLALFWMKTPSPDAKIRLPLVWNGGGSVPVTVQRSNWNNDEALFVGLKGGSPSGNHGHMDGGAFVLDTKGVRWAVDLGAEPYARIERRGMKLWNSAQGSDRWKLYRLNTWSHNTLMLDDAPQAVRGTANVAAVREADGASEVTLDLTSLYPAAKRVTRTGRMAAGGRSYALADSVAGFRAGGKVRWSMLTCAAVKVAGNRVTLRQAGQTLELRSCGRDLGTWSVGPAQGPAAWDSPNRGVSQLTLTTAADAQGASETKVTFTMK